MNFRHLQLHRRLLLLPVVPVDRADRLVPLIRGVQANHVHLQLRAVLVGLADLLRLEKGRYFQIYLYVLLHLFLKVFVL